MVITAITKRLLPPLGPTTLIVINYLPYDESLKAYRFCDGGKVETRSGVYRRTSNLPLGFLPFRFRWKKTGIGNLPPPVH